MQGSVYWGLEHSIFILSPSKPPKTHLWVHTGWRKKTSRTFAWRYATE